MDLKIMLLEHILARENITTIFRRISQLRKVSRGWQAFLHDPVPFKRVLPNKYPEALRGDLPGFSVLQEFIVTLVSQKSHTVDEIDFLRRLGDDTDTFMRVVVNSLLDKPLVPILQTKTELLQAVLALRKDPKGYYALLMISRMVSQKEIGRAYRRLMLVTHQDQNGAVTATAKSAEVNRLMR